MKRVILLRHAKSSWKTMGQRDFDRPLNNRGILSANFMAERMIQENLVPDVVFCSSAQRTQETFNIFSKQLHLDQKVRFEKDLYASSFMTILQKINTLDNDYGNAMVIAHNPGISDFLNYCCNSAEMMVTCAMACIEFDTDNWQEISSGTGDLVHFDYPKKHEAFQNLLNT